MKKLIVLVCMISLLTGGMVSEACPKADITGDCKVNLDDFSIMAAEWLSAYSEPNLVIMASEWLTESHPDPNEMVFVTIPAGTLQMGDSFPKNRYTITDLGTLGGTFSYACAINNSGQVVGHSPKNGNSDYHAFLYDKGIMTDLGTLGGNTSTAYDINDRGHVVGRSTIDSSSDNHAFLFDNGAMIDLGTSVGEFSAAYGTNESGQVVGASRRDKISAWHAFLYDKGIMIDLGTLGGISSYAYGINNSGQVVGESIIAEVYANHAFLYDKGEMKDLGTLGGIHSYAYDINDNGQVVGISHIADNSAIHAFLYDKDIMIDIGTLGGNNSYALGINNSGRVVGFSPINDNSKTNVNHAFLYDEIEKIQNLNDMIPPDSGWLLMEACDINSSGQIVGTGKINGQGHAFLLTPIPDTVYITVDIKPHSCSNPLNVKSKGVLPVAILGSETYDTNDIDFDSLNILGVKPIRGHFKDVGSALLQEEIISEDCARIGGPDGFIDLVLKFDTQEIVGVLADYIYDYDQLILTLEGHLNDGTPIEGTDCVKILGR